MKIVFFIISLHGDALKDPAYCEENALGGSETAALKMGECFRRRGHEVVFITDPEALNNLKCDVFIALRYWQPLYNGMRPGSLNYLWCQDDIDQPLVKPLSDPAMAAVLYNNCDAVMMISHYQIRRWQENLNLPTAKIFKTENAVDLPLFNIDRSTLKDRPPKAYYASTPFRGLLMLAEMWPVIHDAVPEAELVVSSSMQTYKLGERDAGHAATIEKIKTMPGVTYYAGIGQRKLREIAASSRVLAYPCIFAETGCIAAMEAMASGCVVVGTDLGALPETAWRNPLVPMQETWWMHWAFEVARLLVDDHAYYDLACQNLDTAKNMGWEKVAERWLRRFHSDSIAKRAAAAAAATTNK